jgi:hypothetical protein
VERILPLVNEETALILSNEATLKRGEFVSAYRKFLEDHRSDQLKAIKEDTWTRVYRLFMLPEASHALYNLIDPLSARLLPCYRSPGCFY